MTDIVSALMLLLSLRFRTKDICCCRFAFAQKTSVAAAALSHKKTSAAVASLSRKKHLLLTLRFRAKNICRPKHKADSGRNYVEV
ncbi:hypothetical protein ACIQ1D_11975 [Lysinibacillus xylanilyticus]|uniref:hypothetical protein n=1 Tax=Lysinibacillus xylanilyticus TaxID=582475 RepID=UPI00381A3146